MVQRIKIVLFDIDGVITDGRRYFDGAGAEFKSLAFKDLDALQMLKDAGYKIGCVTGEDTLFNSQFVHMAALDYAKAACKQKTDALQELEKQQHISESEICYIGDGKYDIPVMEKVGLALCPNDAIEEVKQVADIILKRNGGDGCIAEVYTLLQSLVHSSVENGSSSSSVILSRLTEHEAVVKSVLENKDYISQLETAVEIIIKSYQTSGCLFLCGNGGSAADAQHLAAELVGRFYLERRALPAEALTVNTSILTALSNDYDYNVIFSRQLEAKAAAGDVLIGITTSGTSENILRAFHKAKELHMKTVLMTGDIAKYAPILAYTDCLLAVPSCNTPRIQEMHILTGHIICELVEQEMSK